MGSAPISFGCCLYPVQGLDLVGFVDVLTNLSSAEISKYGPLLPDVDLQSLLDASLDITFHWISCDMQPVRLTGNMSVQPTCTYADCPNVDYLLVGGPDPDRSIGDSTPVVELRKFLLKRADGVRKIFTTCTGALTLASTGLLDGQEATVNHALIDVARDHFPDVRWTDAVNWIEGDKFWTSSGAVAGMDMAGEWVRQQHRHGYQLLYVSTLLLDWAPRDVNGRTVDHVNGNGLFIRGVKDSEVPVE